MKKNYFIVKYDYKTRLDSIYVNILGDHGSTNPFELSDNVIIDFDKNKKPVSFKIEDPSLLLDVKKNLLKKLSEVRIDLEVTPEKISFWGRFFLKIDNDTVEKSFQVEKSNINGIPSICSNFASMGSY